MGLTQQKEEWTTDKIEAFINQAGTEVGGDFGGEVKGGIYCQQVPDEMARCLMHLIDGRESIENYLEVGAAAGGTTYLIDYFLHPHKIVIVDNNSHPSAWRREKVLDSVTRYEIIGHSASVKTTQALEDHMKHERFDLIFIDADHSYANCKRDTILYKQYLRLGGYLLFHDSDRNDLGVKKVVWEMKQDDRMELVDEFLSTKRAPLGLALFRRVA